MLLLTEFMFLKPNYHFYTDITPKAWLFVFEKSIASILSNIVHS